MQERLIAALVASVIGAGVAYKATDWHWQVKWDKRDIAEASAKQALTDEYRGKEQKLLKELDDVRKNTSDALQKAADSAVAAADLFDGVHRDAEKLADSLASCNAESAQRSAAGAKVLAELFRRADETAGRMAQYADDATIRGVACEQLYNNAKGEK